MERLIVYLVAAGVFLALWIVWIFDRLISAEGQNPPSFYMTNWLQQHGFLPR